MKRNNSLSLVDLPPEMIDNGISPQLNLHDLARLARTSKGINSLFQKSFQNAKLTQLLKHVAFGEQDQAEKILKADPALLLEKGTVTDGSGRTFNNITAFQYAVWALDWHMWTMILKYLPQKAASEQAQESKKCSWVTQHGLYAGVPEGPIYNLVNALQTLIQNWDIWPDTQRNQHWVHQVGSAQFLLPAHVVNEYCHPTRTFAPTPDFTQLQQAGWRTRTACKGLPYQGEWFTLQSNGGGLGHEFSYGRGDCLEHVGLITKEDYRPKHPYHIHIINIDYKGVLALAETRMRQRTALITTLQAAEQKRLSKKTIIKNYIVEQVNQQIEVFKQTSSINTKEKAREFYHKGKTAFYTGDKSSAMTFFLQAKDHYKDLLTNVELDLPSKQEAEKRLNHLKNPEGKYAPKKLTQCLF